MGRHALARKRRKSPVVLATIAAPAAVFFAVGADVHPLAASPVVEPVVRDVAKVVEDASPCCFEIVAAASAAPVLVAADGQPSADVATLVSASRYRAVDRTLPVGVAFERGLQVKTILAARAISAAFPEIHNIGGVRPDPLPWHPNGLAIDVMIPNPGSPEGIALGNEIVSYVYRNAARFGMQDAIWRGVYYTPNGGQRSGGYGHYDHVHITTTGGGYPTGNEIYIR